MLTLELVGVLAFGVVGLMLVLSQRSLGLGGKRVWLWGALCGLSCLGQVACSKKSDGLEGKWEYDSSFIEQMGKGKLQQSERDTLWTLYGQLELTKDKHVTHSVLRKVNKGTYEVVKQEGDKLTLHFKIAGSPLFKDATYQALLKDGHLVLIGEDGFPLPYKRVSEGEAAEKQAVSGVPVRLQGVEVRKYLSQSAKDPARFEYHPEGTLYLMEDANGGAVEVGDDLVFRTQDGAYLSARDARNFNMLSLADKPSKHTKWKVSTEGDDDRPIHSGLSTRAVVLSTEEGQRLQFASDNSWFIIPAH